MQEIDDGLDQGSSTGGGEKWWDSVCNLMLEPTGFIDGFDVERELEKNEWRLQWFLAWTAGRMRDGERCRASRLGWWIRSGVQLWQVKVWHFLFYLENWFVKHLPAFTAWKPSEENVSGVQQYQMLLMGQVRWLRIDHWI